jgi:hypothetical protein
LVITHEKIGIELKLQKKNNNKTSFFFQTHIKKKNKIKWVVDHPNQKRLGVATAIPKANMAWLWAPQNATGVVARPLDASGLLRPEPSRVV